jgi:hypothetical protein
LDLKQPVDVARFRTPHFLSKEGRWVYTTRLGRQLSGSESVSFERRVLYLHNSTEEQNESLVMLVPCVWQQDHEREEASVTMFPQTGDEKTKGNRQAVDALALRADEGRGQRRNASGSG